MGAFSTPDQLSPALVGIRSRWKREVTRGYFIVAGWQRDYARSHLASWQPPEVAHTVPLDVATLACERDSLELFRMVTSFLQHVGQPQSFSVFSDGSLSNETIAALQRLSPIVRVTPAVELAFPLHGHPIEAAVRADKFPHATKLLVLAQSPQSRPRLYLDTDIEFFPGAWRFRQCVARSPARPRYMAADVFYYDERMTTDLDLLPAVNAGFVLLSKSISWRRAFDRLMLVLDAPTGLSEQTAVAIALSEASAAALPEADYVLAWDDLRFPWDPYARRDTVLRHYASPAIRWKLWLRGGPKGVKALPRAAFRALID
jgi:hypothetical protein